MALHAHAGYWVRAYPIHNQNDAQNDSAHQLMFTGITHNTAHLRLSILQTSPSLSRKDSTFESATHSSRSMQSISVLVCATWSALYSASSALNVCDLRQKWVWGKTISLKHISRTSDLGGLVRNVEWSSQKVKHFSGAISGQSQLYHKN